MMNGKQYIIVAVSGGNYSGEYIAFTLPEKEEPGRPRMRICAFALLIGLLARKLRRGRCGMACIRKKQAGRGQGLYNNLRVVSRGY
jgi:hypothetical protein